MEWRITKALAEISAELETVRLTNRSAIDEVLPWARSMLDVENLIVYSVSERLHGWSLDRWHHDGNAHLVRDRLTRVFHSASRDMFPYRPSCPKPEGRNRPVEATSWLDRAGPGTFESSPLCREVFAPLGLHRHKQLRVLVCDGPSLLAWFGMIHDGRVTRRHHQLLSAMIPAMQARLKIERQLELGARAVTEVNALLAHIGAPAFLLGPQGVIREANASARELLAQRREDIFSAVEAARAGRSSELEVELTPVAAPGMPKSWLAVIRTSRDVRSAHCIATATRHWKLTPRQQQVLAGIVQGHSTATIATCLEVGERAIELHITRLLDHAGVDGRAALVAHVLSLR